MTLLGDTAHAASTSLSMQGSRRFSATVVGRKDRQVNLGGHPLWPLLRRDCQFHCDGRARKEMRAKVEVSCAMAMRAGECGSMEQGSYKVRRPQESKGS